MHKHPHTMPLSAVFILITFLAGWTQASAQCPNLIVNGDFEAGNTGFSSDYTNNQTTIWGESTYAITTDPYNQHPHFYGNDHTSGTGYLMAVNGATTGGKIVWQQTVDVSPGSRYSFSGWVSNMIYGTPAGLLFRINGAYLDNNPFYTSYYQYIWAQFNKTWESGTYTSATIQIIDFSTVAAGNDFGLDDLDFRRIDEVPPVITTAPLASIWPVNHKYKTFALGELATATDDCDTQPDLFIISVGSDEPEDANGGGDGSTLDDIVISPSCQAVQLRAERQGGGNGRVYSIHVRAVDDMGNFSDAVCHIEVRHNVGLAAVDDGASAGYTVIGCLPGAPKRSTRGTPEGFTLEQNYPNPFNPATTVSYSIPVDGMVTLRVFDALGNEVATLVDEYNSAGMHRVEFDASQQASGMYVYRLESGGTVLERRMQLVK